MLLCATSVGGEAPHQTCLFGLLNCGSDHRPPDGPPPPPTTNGNSTQLGWAGLICGFRHPSRGWGTFMHSGDGKSLGLALVRVLREAQRDPTALLTESVFAWHSRAGHTHATHASTAKLLLLQATKVLLAPWQSSTAALAWRALLREHATHAEPRDEGQQSGVVLLVLQPGAAAIACARHCCPSIPVSQSIPRGVALLPQCVAMMDGRAWPGVACVPPRAPQHGPQCLFRVLGWAGVCVRADDCVSAAG